MKMSEKAIQFIIQHLRTEIYRHFSYAQNNQMLKLKVAQIFPKTAQKVTTVLYN